MGTIFADEAGGESATDENDVTDGTDETDERDDTGDDSPTVFRRRTEDDAIGTVDDATGTVDDATGTVDDGLDELTMPVYTDGERRDVGLDD